ncbi:MAG: hypothetical protein HY204_03475 [Nitrospirae bacterium]|nr:hypothetical protein [Nitrospirota bacterium]
MIRKDGQVVYCYEPPPDVLTASVQEKVEASIPKIKEALKAGGEIQQTYQRIRAEVPGLQEFEVLHFRLCTDYGNDALDKDSYEAFLKVLTQRKSEQSSQANENKMSGVLQPANDPTPITRCNIPSNFFTVYIGKSAFFSDQFPHTVLRVASEDLISFGKEADAIYLTAKIFSADHRIVATIDKNKFDINPNNYFRIERPDSHTLIVYDQQARQVLNVRYLNSSSIKLIGTFHFPNYEPIIIGEDKVMIGTNSFIIGCSRSNVDIVID